MRERIAELNWHVQPSIPVCADTWGALAAATPAVW